MTAPNHVAGGIAFTGIFASFWNINIFASSLLIGGTVFFSVLPDIDHTKSLIGKCFKPLARHLDRAYGHRTITHSMAAMVMVFLVLALLKFALLQFFPELAGNEHFQNMPLVFGLAFTSHIIFDMMTLQGVPLFWPWLKNPCVIPGDPKLRFRTNDVRAGAIFFTAFCCITAFCYPLMKNGFWTTYNNAFGSQDHIAREFVRTDKVIEASYYFRKQGKEYKGQGLVIHAESKRTIIFEQGKGIIDIQGDDPTVIVEKIQGEHTDQVRVIKTENIYEKSAEEVTELFKGKIILHAKLSATDFIHYAGMMEAPTKRIQMQFVEGDFYHFQCGTTDTLNKVNDDQAKEALHLRLQSLQVKLASQRTRYKEQRTKYQALLDAQTKAQTDYANASLSEKELIQADLNRLEKDLNNFRFNESDPVLIAEVTGLRKQIRNQVPKKIEKQEPCKIYGTVEHIIL